MCWILFVEAWYVFVLCCILQIIHYVCARAINSPYLYQRAHSHVKWVWLVCVLSSANRNHTRVSSNTLTRNWIAAAHTRMYQHACGKSRYSAVHSHTHWHTHTHAYTHLPELCIQNTPKIDGAGATRAQSACRYAYMTRSTQAVEATPPCAAVALDFQQCGCVSRSRMSGHKSWDYLCIVNETAECFSVSPYSN